ncbi:hypothetical protein ACJD0Z_18345 [Flavobacteriaceae bacterium M23B6Z8]
MKNIIISFFLSIFYVGIQAQEISGSVTLNGKTKAELSLESNSAVQLFKEFKEGKYKLGFEFEAFGLPQNIYGEKIVFFNFRTIVKKDGKVIKETIREAPLPYFPGDMFLAAESFDFIPVLASIDQMAGSEEGYGTMPEGNYQIQLIAKPVGFKGTINPLNIYFVLRRRPTR